MAYPNPLEPFRAFLCESTVMKAYSGRIQRAYLLEPHRWVPWIDLNQGKTLVRKNLNLLRKLPVGKPEARRGKMLHNGLQLPLL